MIMKMDKRGNLIWEQRYGDKYEDGFSDISVIPGGGFIISGSNGSSDGDANPWILKLDNSGKCETAKTIVCAKESDNNLRNNGH